MYVKKYNVVIKMSFKSFWDFLKIDGLVIRRLPVEVWVQNFEVNSQPNKEQPYFNIVVSGTVAVPFDFLLLIRVFAYFYYVTNDHVVEDFHDWLVDWRQSRWLGPHVRQTEILPTKDGYINIRFKISSMKFC